MELANYAFINRVGTANNIDVIYRCYIDGGKNGFVGISKNLARNRSENNFVWTIKILLL